MLKLAGMWSAGNEEWREGCSLGLATFARANG